MSQYSTCSGSTQLRVEDVFVVRCTCNSNLFLFLKWMIASLFLKLLLIFAFFTIVTDTALGQIKVFWFRWETNKSNTLRWFNENCFEAGFLKNTFRALLALFVDCLHSNKTVRNYYSAFSMSCAFCISEIRPIIHLLVCETPIGWFVIEPVKVDVCLRLQPSGEQHTLHILVEKEPT